MVKHDDILEAVKDRKTWENRQEVFYRMRHDGIRRANKPWKNAADMHFPLGDMTIEKLTPFYVQQLYALDSFATFYSLSPELVPYQTMAAQWFDWQLRQYSNFEDEIELAVDAMLQAGHCPVKCYWDSKAKRLCFEAIEPTKLIVPSWTNELETADWFVHVQEFSKAAYKLRADFDQTILGEILGGEPDTQEEETRKLREGITFSRSKDMVIVWEVFGRTSSGWEIETYSPAKPTKPVKKPFMLPYNKGVFGEGERRPPVVVLQAERKKRGHYSSRGIMERVAPFEQSLNHDWNTIKDYQTLTCSPIFSAKGAPPNTSNIRFRPGDVLGYDLQAVAFPPIPVDVRQGMNETRLVAEQAVAMPDFGTTQTQQTGSKPRTAREISMVANVMGQGIDVRGRRFRRSIAKLLECAWALCLQYRAEELQYMALEQLGNLPGAALSEKYKIELAGSADNCNRPLMLQKAQSRWQMFHGAPNVDQDELTRSVIELDDPRLVRRLFRPAQDQAATQMQRQAQEIGTMLLGFPAQLRPDDDDAAHLQTLIAFAGRMRQAPMPVAPDAVQQLAQHAQQHLQKLGQANPQAAQQFAQQIQTLMGAAPQPQQPMPPQ